MLDEGALQRAAGLFTAGRLDEAREVATALATSEPDSFLVHHLLGAIEVRAGNAAAALAHETRALALRPGDLEALCNRGIALRALDRIDEALADYESVLAARPNFAPALNLRGVALAALNRHTEAIASYTRAIELEPHFAPAHFNRSLSELVLGNLEAGWRDFEWRWTGSDTQFPKRAFREPPWRGEDPRGKTILVHAEQGFGDAIQCARYVPLLAERGADVVFEVQPPLAELFSTLPARIVPMGAPLPRFDVHCPMLSLPFHFGTRLDSVPANVPYLRAPEAHVTRWRERLGARTTPRIGIVWSGNATQKNDRNRSMALSHFARLRDPRWTVVSLQKDIRESDRASFEEGVPILHFGDELRDFRDTAALIELVDVVVAVDTGTAHLAGAMGKPVWILLSFLADWRWLLGRDDNPWYPTARLFWQEQPREWEPVVDRVGRELLRLLK